LKNNIVQTTAAANRFRGGDVTSRFDFLAWLGVSPSGAFSAALLGVGWRLVHGAARRQLIVKDKESGVPEGLTCADVSWQERALVAGRVFWGWARWRLQLSS